MLLRSDGPLSNSKGPEGTKACSPGQRPGFSIPEYPSRPEGTPARAAIFSSVPNRHTLGRHHVIAHVPSGLRWFSWAPTRGDAPGYMPLSLRDVSLGRLLL